MISFFQHRFFSSAIFLAFFCTSAVAQNILSNGNMEYGDGGWYLWNNPDGPATVEMKLAEPGLGYDGAEGDNRRKATAKNLVGIATATAEISGGLRLLQINIQSQRKRPHQRDCPRRPTGLPPKGKFLFRPLGNMANLFDDLSRRPQGIRDE